MTSVVFSRALRPVLSDERGATLALAAWGMAIGALVVGMAVDMSHYTQTKSQFRNAVDQALLAVASSATDSTSNRASMNDYARQYLEANFTRLESGAKVTKLHVSYDATKNEWTADAAGTTPTSFAKLLGVKHLTLNHTAKVAWDEVSTEVVFALDLSASMCVRFQRDGSGKLVPIKPARRECNNPAASTKLVKAREALEYLVMGNGRDWKGLPAITSRDGRPAYKIGIVPFNHKVKFPDVSKIPEPVREVEETHPKGDKNYFNWSGNRFQSEPGAAETAEYPLPVITPLIALKDENDRRRLQAEIAKLRTEYDVPGWTRSNLGFMAAGLMLDPAHKNAYPGGESPAAIGAPRNKKILFLLTDGANMGCCFSSHPGDSYQYQYLYTYRTDNAHMSGAGNPKEGLCGAFKEAGYTVYTIVYDVQDEDALGGGATIKKILSDCASGPKGEFFFDLKVDEDEQIKKAYKTIAQSLMRLRLSY